jgi:hypothetical protein
MKAVDLLRVTLKTSRRKLKLSPMYKILRRFKQQGLDPKTLNALEVFGSDGQNHTKDIASVVAGLEIWEIESKHETILRRDFPQAEIKITDSYAEIKQTPQKYGLVIVDNTSVAFSHYEHFDLFPDVFRVLTNPAMLILNVMPKVLQNNPDRLRQRQLFYNAADPKNISLAEIEQTYRTLAAQYGWLVDWIFFERRWTFYQRKDIVYYAVLKLVKGG